MGVTKWDSRSLDNGSYGLWLIWGLNIGSSSRGCGNLRSIGHLNLQTESASKASSLSPKIFGKAAVVVSVGSPKGAACSAFIRV